MVVKIMLPRDVGLLQLRLNAYLPVWSMASSSTMHTPVCSNTSMLFILLTIVTIKFWVRIIAVADKVPILLNSDFWMWDVEVTAVMRQLHNKVKWNKQWDAESLNRKDIQISPRMTGHQNWRQTAAKLMPKEERNDVCYLLVLYSCSKRQQTSIPNNIKTEFQIRKRNRNFQTKHFVTFSHIHYCPRRTINHGQSKLPLSFWPHI